MFYALIDSGNMSMHANIDKKHIQPTKIYTLLKELGNKKMSRILD